MKSIRFISTLVVVVFLMAAIGSTAWADGTTRPNIIFILTDDISPKDYAFYGGKTASPVLEKMAKEGLYFKTAWATPKCVPTRAMLLTGKYPFRTKVFENQVNPRGADHRMKPVGERFPNTLGSLMTANGYRTAMIGKIQTGTVQSYGFQRWCLVNQGQIFDMKHSDNNVDGRRVVQRDVHSTDSLFDYLHGFTAEKAKEPWFVYMPLNLPHWVRNPDNPSRWGAPIVPELDSNWQKTGKLVQNDFEACIRYIDYKIGGFVEHLKATGQLENTIIMYAGDNGSGAYGKSNPDSEKGPRVPFVVYAPGYLKPMGACDELVDFTDVVPTCVELAGGSLPKGDIFDGHSFAPLIQGKPFQGREWIFTQWYGCRWLRTKQWLIDGRGRFYDCSDHRNEWVQGAYKDVTESADERVVAVRKNLERILETMPAPDYDDPELAAQWEKEWVNSRKFVQPYVPPYLESAEVRAKPRPAANQKRNQKGRSKGPRQRQNPFADIGLSQEQQMQVQEFQRSMQAEMKKASESRDREKIQAAQKKYQAGLAKILDEEQMKKYKAAIAKMRESRIAAPQPLGQSKRQSVVQSATDDQTATAKKRPVSAGTTSSEENLDLLFSDPPNEYRIVKYQLNNKTLVQYPQYGFGGYQPFFYDNLYKAGPTGPSTIGPLVDAANAQGRTVWSADDAGYPSGSAGGKVVENNPEYEVRGVAMLTTTGSGQAPVSIATPSDCEKMISAVLYPVANGVPDFSQGQVQPVQDTGVNTTGLTGDWQLCAFILKIRDTNTQSADKAARFGITGRYPDLLNPNAVASWISLMHEPIIAQITDPASQLEGFYFNEPSLQQLNWHTTAYATLPWNAELFNHFQTMHGYDLQPAMGALYEGDDLHAKRVRMHFHQTVGEMLRISFTGQLAEWCEKRGLVASGHPLLEEYLRMHVANFGDMLKVVSELQVPAMDLPMPEPGQMARHNFHFPKLFSSAGGWNEHDSRVIALLDPVIGGYGRNRKVPSEEALHIAVNGAFRCGVNLFATYIDTEKYGSTAAVFKQLNEYTGRISAVLTGARIATPVALYYPIEMFQMEYKPITARHFGKWNTRRQFAWDNLQTTMLDAEVDYNIVHPEWVRDAAIEGGELKIGSGSYRYLVMPDVEVISSKVLAKIQQFEAGGGTVLWVDGKPMAGAYPSEDAQVVGTVAGIATVSAAQVPGLIPNPYDANFTLNVTSQDALLTTRFKRQGRGIYFLVNPTGSSITAHLDDANGGSVKVYDPVTGKITLTPLPTDVVIDAYKSVLIVPMR